MEGNFLVGLWLIEPALNAVSYDGQSIHLTPKAMGVLVCLAEHAGHPVSKEDLLHSVWPDTFVGDDVLKGSISELRRALEDNAREPTVIQTIPKRGYRLVAPVRPINGSPGSLTETPSMQHTVVRAPWFWLGVLAVTSGVLLIAFLSNVGGLRSGLTGKPGPTQIRSLAVLPLQNLSVDPAQEYFSDGMTDALITDLAQISSLKVISRTSSMRYKQTKKSLPKIARELNVDGIVEGTVQRSGNRVRITAQLIYGPSDKHIWAHSYERDMPEVFSLERDVTEQVAREVQARLKLQNQEALAQPRPVNPNALEAYLQGNYYLHKGTGDEDMKKAQRYFQQAIDADPTYAPAYLGMAESHYALLWSTADDRVIRRASVEKAVTLDPSSSDARTALADVKFADWDWRGAEEEFRRALALNPNDASAHAGLCSYLDIMERLDESLTECEIAQQLDPNNDHLAQTMEARGQYDRAVELLMRDTERSPDDGFIHYFLYRDYALLGKHNESVHELEKSLTLVGRSEIAAKVHRVFVKSGYREALREWAKDLERLHGTNQIFLPRLLAEVYAQLGDNDRAFYWLEQGYVHRDRIGNYGSIEMIQVEHQLDPLRSDLRYPSLVRRIGLPAAPLLPH